LRQIPKWTRAKFEIATAEQHNPLKQDEKKGVLRDYKWGGAPRTARANPRAPSGLRLSRVAFSASSRCRADMVFNYGALPQTWEDPAHHHADTGCKGDNDPLDAVELGYRAMPSGSVAPVKVLGVLAMIDDGETDWKLLVLRADDPLAAVCHCVADVERELPGAIHALREWLRVYKLPEGKPVNAFALEERAMPRDYAMRVVAATHAAWAAAHGASAHKRARAQHHSAAPAEEDAAAAHGGAAARL